MLRIVVSEGRVSHSEEVCFWVKKDVELLNKIQQRATKMRRALELSFEGRFRGILSVYANSWRRYAKWMEPGSLQRCPVTGPGAQTETQKAPSEHSVREWSSTGTGRPETCCGVSILGENQKPTGHNPGQPALGVPGGVGHRCFPQVPSVFLRDMGI